MISDLINTIIPKSEKILPISLPIINTPNVPDDDYLRFKTNFGKSPEHQKYLRKCATLTPSPRNNIDNNPACQPSKYFPLEPFKRDECYMLFSPQQNIWGPVCGGADNGNWVRGNQFATNYDYQKIFNGPLYEVDVPKFTKKNPVIVSDSRYFPFEDYYNRFNPKYKSYPYVNNYLTGQPFYDYPYDIVENFTNYKRPLFQLIGLIILFLIIYFLSKYYS